MKTLITRLREAALDSSVPLADLLRIGLVVASHFGADAFNEWLRQELNGYNKPGDTPTYRELHGKLVAQDLITNRTIPLQRPPLDDELLEGISRRSPIEPSPTIEEIFQGRSDGGQFAFEFPTGLEETFFTQFHTMGRPMKLRLVIPWHSVGELLDAVRTTVLEWALQLDKAGVEGKEGSFSSAEKQRGQEVTNNYYETHVNITNSGNAASVAVGSRATAGTSRSDVVISNSSLEGSAVVVGDSNITEVAEPQSIAAPDDRVDRDAWHKEVVELLGALVASGERLEKGHRQLLKRLIADATELDVQGKTVDDLYEMLEELWIAQTSESFKTRIQQLGTSGILDSIVAGGIWRGIAALAGK